jgi:hypothetical protein
MSKLIDADELKKNSDITNWNKPYGCSFDVIDRIPTAYDVEKVVAELKETNKNEVNAEMCPSGFIHCLTAIDIVRKGGAV